jgi:hypothetical protein
MPQTKSWRTIYGHRLARDLAEIATHIGQLKGEANAYLSYPSYDRLHHRLENALSLLWRLRP